MAAPGWALACGGLRVQPQAYSFLAVLVVRISYKENHEPVKVQAPAQPSSSPPVGAGGGGSLYPVPAPWPVSPGWPGPLWVAEEQHSRPGGILLPSTLLPGKPALPCLPAQAVLPALRGSDHRQSRLCHSAPVTPSELAGLSASPGTLSAFGLPLCAPVPSHLLPRAPSPPHPHFEATENPSGAEEG